MLKRLTIRIWALQWGLMFGGALLAAPAAAQQTQPYSIDPAQSKIELNVYKEGAFKFLAHDHLIAARKTAGQVHLDAQHLENSGVTLTVEAKSLAVVDPGIGEKERHDIQTTMESDRVLDVARYPQITFASTGVSQVKAAENGYELQLTGTLTLHGVTRTITLPLRVRLESNRLRVQGETSLVQTDYQITPVRVGGGTVKVKDRLKITFDIVALK